jgi:hypothetical protein
MSYETLFVYLIGKMVNSYWEAKNLVGYSAKVGEWGIETSLLDSMLYDGGYKFMSQIIKVTRVEGKICKGISLAGSELVWENSRMCAFPQDIQDVLNSMSEEDTIELTKIEEPVRKKGKRRDPEKLKENLRRWRKANPEKARETLLRWKRANPEKEQEYKRKTYLRKKEEMKRTKETG